METPTSVVTAINHFFLFPLLISQSFICFLFFCSFCSTYFFLYPLLKNDFSFSLFISFLLNFPLFIISYSSLYKSFLVSFLYPISYFFRCQSHLILSSINHFLFFPFVNVYLFFPLFLVVKQDYLSCEKHFMVRKSP